MTVEQDDDFDAPRERLPLSTRIRRLIDLPPLWTAAALAGVWGMTEMLGAVLPASIRLSGWILIALAVLMMLWAVRHMLRADTAVMPHRSPRILVRTGPFRYTRNPIYLADLLVVVGLAMALGQPAGAMLVLPLGYILQKRFIEPEEARLDKNFDHQFRAWSAEIPRWF
ncbi:MAG: isoprenylcysteine carboxylmethyltransferase family protein [Pseudomonadota bacterium]